MGKKGGMKKAAMKKGMKAMKAMKAMKKKAMKRKAMKVSKIAKGKRARSSVFRGTKEKTQSGLAKADMMKSKSGRIVCKKARKELGIKGFCPVGGKTAQGKALYAKVKSL